VNYRTPRPSTRQLIATEQSRRGLTSSRQMSAFHGHYHDRL
jgi:hypothetical protein